MASIDYNIKDIEGTKKRLVELRQAIDEAATCSAKVKGTVEGLKDLKATMALAEKAGAPLAKIAEQFANMQQLYIEAEQIVNKYIAANEEVADYDVSSDLTKALN